MPIKVACKCGQSFAAKDELAGKTVNCPKCKQPLKIPAPTSGAKSAQRVNPQAAPRIPAGGPPAGGPVADLGDLFDEIGVKAEAPTAGPRCPSCGKGLAPYAVLCVHCGFNLQTGQRVVSMAPQISGGDEDPHSTAGQAEMMIAKAAREIAESPISAEGKDFGEANNPLTWLLAICLPLLFLVALFAALQWVQYLAVPFAAVLAGIISGHPVIMLMGLFLGAAGLVFVATWFKITFTALDQNPFLGLLCILVPLVFAAVYGFVRWQKLLVITIAYVVSGFITISLSIGVVILALAIQGAQGGAPSP